MKWYNWTTLIVLAFAHFIPTHKSAQYLLNFVIVPICNAFFLTLNEGTQKEAIAGCAQKGMVLADMARNDCYQLFTVPGVKMWINSYSGLAAPMTGTKKTAITLYINPFNPLAMRAFPLAEDESQKMLFICQLPTLSLSVGM